MKVSLSTTVRTDIFVSMQRHNLEMGFQGSMVFWGAVYVTPKMSNCWKSSPYIVLKFDRKRTKTH